jgi:DNA-binding Xre family transcriptional regulator
LEDAKDRAGVDAYLARRAEGRDDGLPIELYHRLLAGEHPVRIWREQRKLALNALAAKAGVARAYLFQIENRKQPGSVAALQRLAKALDVGLDDLVRLANPVKTRRSAHR